MVMANPQNYVTSTVGASAVQAPNSSQVSYGAADLQQSVQINGSTLVPVPVQTYSAADTGPNYDGYGYAIGDAFARAEAGVLKVSAHAEAQVVAQPLTNVGASVKAKSLAQWNDNVVFSAIGGFSNQLIVSGSLLLDGTMSASSGYANLTVGGTGLSTFGGEWVGESNGTLKSANGVYSTWTPGSLVTIPFTFSVINGLKIELSYWMKSDAEASGSFRACGAEGNLCGVVQQYDGIANLDYSHSLVWGGVSVTDIYGTPVSFTTSSTSGFNYAAAYAPVPIPGSAWLLVSGLLGLAATKRCRKIKHCSI